MKLNPNLLHEIIKCCLISKSFAEIITKHLKYEFIPNESLKRIYKEIYNSFLLKGSLETIGTLSQKFDDNELIIDELHEIRETSVSSKQEEILKQFEVFIKQSQFVDLYKEVGELYNNGESDKAIKLLAKKSKDINEFTILKSFYKTVFSGFDARLAERQLKDPFGFKIPTGIHPFDFFTNGGIKMGTSCLFLGRSGRWKSTVLKWIGVHAARCGYRVVHFQAEGTEEEAFELYDAAWTGVTIRDIEYGNIPDKTLESIREAQKDILNEKGEIFVYASESFDTMTINDCNSIIDDIEKIHGKVHLAIFDYLEVFNVAGKYGNTEAGERKRREDIANKMTNIGTEKKLAVVTATQANDIRPEKYNNPDFYMTRSDCAEFKGVVKPFSYFVTINQTDDEYEKGVVRMYNDKLRKARGSQVYAVAISPENARFYDSTRTLDLFWNQKAKKIKAIKLDDE